MPINFLHDAIRLDSVEAGQRIRALRKSRGLNQTQLAKLVGVDQSTVSDIERGGNFNATILMALSDALEASPQYIMRGGIEAEIYEAELLAVFRSLSQDDQQSLLKLLRGLIPHAAPFPVTKS